MRPIKLTLTAFGPYKDTEVIDFTTLEEHSLFVISGNTGSGKTTIFDGICFALYGTASGEHRDHVSMLRSHFADDEIHTSVELIFEMRGRTFRVFRQLPHRKEGNKTATGDRYEFYELVDGEEINIVDRQRVSDINEKIEQLLGLTEDQFKQIVMLPQGEFLKLLTSETENKEAILRRLFKTDHYQQLTTLLRERKNKLEKNYETKRQLLDQQIESIQSTLPFRKTSELFMTLQAEEKNIKQILTGLKQEKDFYAAKKITDEQKYEIAYQKHNDLQAKLHHSEAINKQFTELEEKSHLLKQLEKEKPKIKALQNKLAAARRAEQVKPYAKQVKQYKDRKTIQKNTIKEMEQMAEKIASKLTSAKKYYETEVAKAPEREKIRQQLDELQRQLPIVEALDDRKKSLNNLERELEKLNKKSTEKSKTFQQTKKKHATMEKKIQELDDDLDQFPKVQTNRTILENKLMAIKTYEQVNSSLLKAKEQMKQAKKDYKAQKLKVAQIEEKWLSNQAHQLAMHLHDGEPCPVCGSVEHPEPALSDSVEVSREEIIQSRNKLSEVQSTLNRSEANVETLAEQLELVTEEIVTLNINIDHISDEKETVEKQLTKNQKTINRLTKAQKCRRNYREKLQQQNQKIEKLQKELEEIDKELQQKQTQLEKDRALIAHDLNQISEDRQNLKQLKQLIKQTIEKKESLEKSWESAQKQLQETENKKTRHATQLEEAMKTFEEINEQLKTSQQTLTKILKNNNFTTIEQFSEAVMEKEAQNTLEADIQSFNKQLQVTTSRVEQLEKELKNQTKVDLEQLQKEVAERKKISEKALTILQQTKQYFDQVDRLKQSIEQASESIAESEEQLGILLDLYNVSRGNNAARLSFERFLQIEYLEEIIEAANQRLQYLSNGQYTLVRSERTESHGRQSGLAFDVFDEYTGQLRDVKTLSGGEKFNASLCLALGMSDVIQSFQGNISIDTMFIDEGFGSLDAESLNKAIETLVDLQASGRMIGVISHVPELKAVFPAVLNVTKTKAGHSETTFEIT